MVVRGLKNASAEIETEINRASIPEEQRSRIKHEWKQSIDAIAAWKSHLLRTVNQEEGKQDALASLDAQTCLLIMDWAMKYLPQRYRERMSDFFGKRGKSWHVSAVITKPEEAKFEVESLTHIFDNCTQNSFAVASIVEYLLNTIKQESPEMKFVNFKSSATTAALCFSVFQALDSEQVSGQLGMISPTRNQEKTYATAKQHQ